MCDGPVFLQHSESFLPTMQISSIEFECSNPDLATCPEDDLLEFAFIGRSNVGKSSLLNMLSGKRALARVSATPGHTKLINFFQVNRQWRLVDLPGYGFAQVARQDKARFNAAVSEYLKERLNLACVFSLIDASIPAQKIDLEFIEWLADNTVPFVLVFTKTDKVSATKVQNNVQAFKDLIAGWFETMPDTYSCSASKRDGRSELLAVIDRTLAAEKAARKAAAAQAPAEPAD